MTGGPVLHDPEMTSPGGFVIPRRGAARTPGQALRAWLDPRGLREAMRARPTVADYRARAASPDRATGLTLRSRSRQSRKIG